MKNDDISKQMQAVSKHCGRLSTSIGGIKSAVTKYANRNKIPFAWHRSFYDMIIDSQEKMNEIANYIDNNVMKWWLEK